MIRVLTLLFAAMIGLAACVEQPTTLGTDGKPLPRLYKISRGDTGKIQFRVLDSVNALRQAAGLSALELDSKLNAAAASSSNSSNGGSKGSSSSSSPSLTALQAKLHYLKIIAELPSYGAKCFSTNISVRLINLNHSNFPPIKIVPLSGFQCRNCDPHQPQIRRQSNQQS